MVASKKSRETPAEQLLRMIEGAPQGAGGFIKPVTVPPLRQLVDAVRGLLAQIRRRFVDGRRETDAVLRNLRLIYRLLWVALAGLGVYVVVDLLLIQPISRPSAPPARLERLPGRAARAIGGPGAPDPGAQTVSRGQPVLKPLSEYLTAIQVRNPFTGLSGGLTLDQPTAKTTKRRLEDLAQGLAVVGIDRGPNPEAIIEDTAAQRTYFVKVGDELNGMIVQDISTQGVVVAYEGEELLLK